MYRTEFDNFRDKFIHTHINDGDVNIYMENKSQNISNKVKRLSLNANKVSWYTASKDFLVSQAADGNGSYAFYNFGNQMRTLQFYEQKSKIRKKNLDLLLSHSKFYQLSLKLLQKTQSWNTNSIVHQKLHLMLIN